MLETATKYILDLLTENEELKKFPKEFTNEAVKWVKSWFLKPEDPKTNAKLEDPNKSIEVKKDIIQDKLDDLKNNAQFQQELTDRLAAFEQQKNILTNTKIKAGGNVQIGDTTTIIYQNNENQITTKVSDVLFNQTKKIDSIVFGGLVTSILGIFFLLLSQFYSKYNLVLFSIGILMLVFGTIILYFIQNKGTKHIKNNIFENREAIDELQSLSINLIDVTKQMRNYLTDNITDLNEVLSKTVPIIEKVPNVLLSQDTKNKIKNKQIAASQIGKSADQLEAVISDLKDALVNAEISKLRGYKEKVVEIIRNLNKTLKK